MNDRLHPWLILLTMFDICFVHATGATAALLLLPMWILALASPYFRRLQRFRVYREIWNIGTLVVFALLVHHAATAGLQHMLQDGLVLAVLCQVHLLNNIGDTQRPDLTFFNSLLIALATSIFASDFWWYLLFIGHTLAFVPALQLHVFTSRKADVSTRVVREVLRDSLVRTLAIAAITACIFVIWPRDFERQGWLKETLSLGHELQVGLTEKIDLDRKKTPLLNNKIALRIEPVNCDLDAIPVHWRTIAFANFDGHKWLPQRARNVRSRLHSDLPWQQQVGGVWQRPMIGTPHTRMIVHQIDGNRKRLAIPLPAQRLSTRTLQGRILSANSSAGLEIIPSADPPRTTVSYTVELARPRANRKISTETRDYYTSLPEHEISQIAKEVVKQLRDSLPHGASDLAIATAASKWLQHNRSYALPGTASFADSINEFIQGDAAGHCEYFATTLAIMLRAQNIPCRVVGGFMVHETSEDGSAMIARNRDAHAWVEALGKDDIWHTLDATPAVNGQRGDPDNNDLWIMASNWLQSRWNEVTNFNNTSRQRSLANIIAIPTRHPLSTLMTLTIVTLWLLYRRRHTQRQPEIAYFEHALMKAKMSLLPGETPRELLTRANTLDLNPKHLEAIRVAAREHERHRYR